MSPIKGVKRFGVKGKLSPRFIGPFRILSRKGEVAYELELPEILSQVHNVFHVSQLKRCVKVPEGPIEFETLNLQPDLTYEEQPEKILRENWKRLRNRAIKYCLVQWKNHPEREATWETEEGLRQNYPQLFRYPRKETSGRSLIQVGEDVTPVSYTHLTLPTILLV